MSFASPFALLDLLALPLVVAAYAVFQRRRAGVASRFATAAMLPNVVDRDPGWRRHVPIAILLLALTALLVGFARPRAMISTRRENATVVLAIDTSRSMAAADLKPNRLEVVKAAAKRFVDHLPAKYRVGVVSFATTAQVAAPATRDRNLVRRALSQLDTGGGTALGDGIAAAVNVGRSVQRDGARPGRAGDIPPAAVVLFTDGIQEGGEVSAGDAVSRARALHVAISPVLVGTAYGFLKIPRVGGYTQFIQVPADPTELRTIAKVTKGHFFVDPRTANLAAVYRDLGSHLGTTRKREEISFVFAIAAVSLLVGGGSLSAVWLRRIP
jgi:Ca-activated chloride channel family protein